MPDRDAFEMALALAAMERDLPLLGVCRGMQLMNLARGGTLIEHLPDVLGHEDHRRVPGAFGDHDVRLARRLARRPRRGRAGACDQVASSQGVDEIGEGFEVTGWASVDDLPEAIEDPSRRSRSACSGIRRPTRRRGDRRAGRGGARMSGGWTARSA